MTLKDGMTISEQSALGTGRPDYHLLAPTGWLNDPCAPGYDAQTGLYHLFYQWNPHSHRWDNISWGHATSRDLMHWEHSKEPVFVPDQAYDKDGIFTGCFYPTGPAGEQDQLSIFYTSVCHLPISWDAPYTRGCEGLAMASSHDGGRTWKKLAANPVLAEEPPAMHVTGFRDPYIASWPAMDRMRDAGPSLYGLNSGGIHGEGPRTFLYAISPDDLTKWEYLHPLVVDVAVNHRPAGRWAGDFGANWECTNFITLKSKHGREQEMVIAGAEGGHEQAYVAKYATLRPDAPRRIPRYANWFFGDLVKQQGQPRLAVGPAGLLDWGLYYAANHFVAPDGRRILWGWLIEEDVADAALAARGWTGCMGVPREIFLQELQDVQGGLASTLEDIGSIAVRQETQRYSLSTLGIRPITELQQLRGKLLVDQAGELAGRRQLLSAAPLAAEVHVEVEISQQTRYVSLAVRHDTDCRVQTVITFDCLNETIVVDRSLSTSRTDINTSPEMGPFTLFRFHDGQVEPLRLTVYLDHDVIEIFANDRFALATRVYTGPEQRGITIASDGAVHLRQAKIWDMETI